MIEPEYPLAPTRAAQIAEVTPHNDEIMMDFLKFLVGKFRWQKRAARAG